MSKPVQMCCVTIGYNTYLMPAADGMKVVALMQNAFTCDRHYEDGYVYRVEHQPNVELALVKPSQVVRPAPEGPTPPKRRGLELLK